MFAHWSQLQSNVALPSGAAAFNAAVKTISECSEILAFYKEMCSVQAQLEICVDASAWKTFRLGAGRVKHLGTKQLWAQCMLKSFVVRVTKARSEDNTATDSLTHA